MEPRLEDAARVLAAEGHKAVTIVPLFLAQGKHVRRELPELVAKLKRDHSGTEFRMTPALGDEPEIVAAITDWVRRAAT